MLSVRISTFCCSSCGWKSFRAKKTASSSRRFMCHRLWDSSYSPEAGIRSSVRGAHYSPAVSRCIRRDHLGSSGASGLRQSFDVAAMRKHPEVHAVHGTRDSSHSCSGRMCNNPGCNTAESATLSPSSLWNTFNWTELPCLKGAGKTIGRGSISREAGFISTWSHERQALIPHAISREAGSHSRRDSKWINSESMWLISVSRDRAKISQSSR